MADGGFNFKELKNQATFIDEIINRLKSQLVYNIKSFGLGENANSSLQKLDNKLKYLEEDLEKLQGEIKCTLSLKQNFIEDTRAFIQSATECSAVLGSAGAHSEQGQHSDESNDGFSQREDLQQVSPLFPDDNLTNPDTPLSSGSGPHWWRSRLE